MPMRIRSAENATHLVISRDSQGCYVRGTALQIATNRWVTARRVIERSDKIIVRMKGGDASAQVLWQNAVAGGKRRPACGRQAVLVGLPWLSPGFRVPSTVLATNCVHSEASAGSARSGLLLYVVS
jgi:hypothetical protein